MATLVKTIKFLQNVTDKVTKHINKIFPCQPDHSFKDYFEMVRLVFYRFL